MASGMAQAVINLQAMKTLFILLLFIGTHSKVEDTTVSQVKKIEIKAAQIKASPQQHSVEDVYSLLTQSTSLTRAIMGKSDSTSLALKEANAQLKIMLKKQDQLQTGVTDGQVYEHQMYIVNKFIDSVPFAFAGTVLFFVIGLLIKKSNSIELK